jgi:drug/metabolite transporter (DMT)-like permease
VGIVIGFAGVLMLNAGASASGNVIGVLIGLFATLSWSVGSVLSMKVPLPDGRMRTSAQMMIGGAALIAISFARGEQVTLMVSAQTWGAWVMLIVGSWLGFGSYMYLLANARPSLATSYAYMNPLVALLLGVFVAGETILPIELAGIAVILASVAFIWLANAGRLRKDRG